MVTPRLPWKFHANRSSRFLVILLTNKQRSKETKKIARLHNTPSPYRGRGNDADDYTIPHLIIRSPVAWRRLRRIGFTFPQQFAFLGHLYIWQTLVYNICSFSSARHRRMYNCRVRQVKLGKSLAGKICLLNSWTCSSNLSKSVTTLLSYGERPVYFFLRHNIVYKFVQNSL